MNKRALSAEAKHVIKGLLALTVPTATGVGIGQYLASNVLDNAEKFEKKKTGPHRRLKKYLEEEMGPEGARSLGDFIEKHDLGNVRLALGQRLKYQGEEIASPVYAKDSWMLPDDIKPGVYSDLKNEPILLHELGHAKVMESTPGKALGVANILGGLAGIGGTVAATSSKLSPRARLIGAGLLAAGMIPNLINEAIPSIMAYRHMKEQHGEEKAREARKLLGKAFGSYVAPTAGLAAGLALATKYVR